MGSFHFKWQLWRVQWQSWIEPHRFTSQPSSVSIILNVKMVNVSWHIQNDYLVQLKLPEKFIKANFEKRDEE